MARGPAMLDWADWSASTFSRAEHSQRPIILCLFARWSHACATFASRVLTAPGVRAAVDDLYVPIQVDVDERPDIADRYGLGGWPSLVLLTPAGDMLAGGTWVEAPRLEELLRQVSAAFEVRRAELVGRKAETQAGWLRPAGPEGAPDTAAPARFLETVLSGPWPTQDVPMEGPRVPDVGTIKALLAVGRAWHDERALATAAGVLEAIAASPMTDAGDGGVFRAAWSPGWSRPERVKLLSLNAALLEAYLEAGETCARRDFRDRARAIGGFLLNVMRRPALGGFAHALASDPGPADPQVPRIDLRAFIDSTALAARALLKAARAFDDAGFGDGALAAIEHVLATAYEREAGVAHVLDSEPRTRGLLADQVAASEAFLEAFDATGMPVYLDLAEELMRSVLRRHWHQEVGALCDRVSARPENDDSGLLAHPLYPLEWNCLASRVLVRIGERTAATDVRGRALDILGAFGPVWGECQEDGAHYAIAALEILGGRPG